MLLYKRMLRTPGAEKKHSEDILKEADSQKELVAHNKQGQFTVFRHVMRGDKLELRQCEN